MQIFKKIQKYVQIKSHWFANEYSECYLICVGIIGSRHQKQVKIIHIHVFVPSGNTKIKKVILSQLIEEDHSVAIQLPSAKDGDE